MMMMFLEGADLFDGARRMLLAYDSQWRALRSSSGITRYRQTLKYRNARDKK